MSQANLELFYDKVIQHPALLNALTSGITTPAEFIARVVMMGNAQGYAFTYEEADAWIAAHAAANDSGELSDMQLEAIAGGKGGWDSFKKGWGEAMQDAFGAPIPAGSVRYRP